MIIYNNFKKKKISMPYVTFHAHTYTLLTEPLGVIL